jgi:hypothetical protein
MIGKIALWVAALAVYAVLAVPLAYIGVFWAFWIWCIASIPALLLTFEGVRLDRCERIAGRTSLALTLLPPILWLTGSVSLPTFLGYAIGAALVPWPLIATIIGIRRALNTR